MCSGSRSNYDHIQPGTSLRTIIIIMAMPTITLIFETPGNKTVGGGGGGNTRIA